MKQISIDGGELVARLHRETELLGLVSGRFDGTELLERSELI